MVIDSKLVSALAEELNRECAGGRIEKIQQPAKNIVVFTVRKDRLNRKLLLSSNTGKARIHFTDSDYENPKEPPMFCMLLRKHLSGACIESVTQLNDDRILCLELKNSDELGRPGKELLIVEMLGRCPNIVLCEESGHILDCIHRTDFRNPGLLYRLPEKPEHQKQTKIFEVPEEGFSRYLDGYYSELEKNEIYRAKSKEIKTLLNNSVKRTEKKLGNRILELERTKTRDEIRKKADLITANLWKIGKNDKVLHCEDYFNDNCPVEIPLDDRLSPQQYAAKLYKEYNKLKTAEQYLNRLIDEAQNQLEFLRSEQYLLEIAESEADIREIRSELTSQGFLKQSKAINKKEKPRSFLEFNAPSGNQILVGRNNAQNDELTFRTARKSDLWFHAKNIHGSHVVLFCGNLEPDLEDIRCAADLAAKYSQSNGDCLVDYCRIRFVKKPAGALPGKVIYTDYATVRIREQ